MTTTEVINLLEREQEEIDKCIFTENEKLSVYNALEDIKHLVLEAKEECWTSEIVFRHFLQELGKENE